MRNNFYFDFFIFVRFEKMAQVKNVRLALIVDGGRYDEDDWGLQSVDILSFEPVDCGINLFIIKTDDFDQRTLKNGAGRKLTYYEAQDIIRYLSKIK